MRPLIFVHEGSQHYLKSALLTAIESGNEVILIGDKSNKSFCDSWVDVSSIAVDRYKEFEGIYKHMSKNPFWFELLCFKRYFVLLGYAEEKKLDEFILCDSDLLVFSNLSSYDYGNYLAAMSFCKNQDNYRWSASPHCSYWTKKGLEQFIEFLMDTYTNGIKKLEEKWNYHTQNLVGGGICDMTLLYLWQQTVPKKIRNTAIPVDNIVFDHMVSKGEVYEKNEYIVDQKFAIKKIAFIDGYPHFIKTTGEKVRTYTLHLQGKSKIYFPVLSRKSTSKMGYLVANLKYYLDTPKRRKERKMKEMDNNGQNGMV